MTGAEVSVLTAIVLAATAAIGTWVQFIGARRQKRADRAERGDQARLEAVQLAETRGEMILDLRRGIDELKEQLRREREHSDKAVKRLEEALTHSREEAQEIQRLLAIGFHGVLVKLLAHLEASPIQTEAAIAYLREMLTDETLLRPARSRRAT